MYHEHVASTTTKKVVLLSEVLLGQVNLQFERRVLFYNNSKLLHDKLPDFYHDYLSEYGEPYVIDMPLDNCG